MERIVQTPSGSAVGHETSDAHARPIVLIGFALAIIVAVMGVISYGILAYLDANVVDNISASPMATEGAQRPPEPRLEEHPALELPKLRAREDELLSTYGWTDKKAGVVRIPIDRAMELQLQRGFPTRAGARKP